MEEALTFEEYKKISKEIKKLMQDERYEEALALCTDDNCKQDIVIQTQKISILLKLGNKQEEIIKECDKAYQIWQDEGFIKSKLITISQMIKKLMQEERYEEALELCKDEYCKQDEVIQGQKISILFKLGNRQEEIIKECNKAYQIWQDEYFIKCRLMAISQIIKRLIQEEKYEEALELCKDDYCKQDIVIQTQKINILELLGYRISDEENQKLNMLFTESTLNYILTKIYFNDITIGELNSLSVDLWEKVILLIAYYEKHSKKTGLELIKQAMIQMDLTKEQQKILNKFKERLSSKKSIIFDCGLYCEILNCSIDFQYVPNHTMDKNLVQNTTTNTTKKQSSLIQKEEPSREENKPKVVGQEGKRINRYSNPISSASVTNPPKEEKIWLIKDVFSKELLEIKKYIYWEMNWGANRYSATRVWDTLECLEMKETTEEYAYQKMLRIIEICVSNQVIQLETKNMRKLENHN